MERFTGWEELWGHFFEKFEAQISVMQILDSYNDAEWDEK